MDNNKIITNIEGLRNPTILQQLEAMREYVIANAKQGETGAVGILTDKSDIPAEIVDLTAQYPISNLMNYTPSATNEELIGRLIYFAASPTAIMAVCSGVGVTTAGIPVFSVSNAKSIKGPQGETGATGPQGPQGPQGETQDLTPLENEIADAKAQILAVSESLQDVIAESNDMRGDISNIQTDIQMRVTLYSHTVHIANDEGFFFIITNNNIPITSLSSLTSSLYGAVCREFYADRYHNSSILTVREDSATEITLNIINSEDGSIEQLPLSSSLSFTDTVELVR